MGYTKQSSGLRLVALRRRDGHEERAATPADEAATNATAWAARAGFRIPAKLAQHEARHGTRLVIPCDVGAGAPASRPARSTSCGGTVWVHISPLSLRSSRSPAMPCLCEPRLRRPYAFYPSPMSCGRVLCVPLQRGIAERCAMGVQNKLRGAASGASKPQPSPDPI